MGNISIAPTFVSIESAVDRSIGKKPMEPIETKALKIDFGMDSHPLCKFCL
jgi:hypothetical protein